MLYKLLKKYPGLPSDWEVGMTIGTGDRMIYLSPTNSKYTNHQLGFDIPTMFPKFWEETKEYKFEQRMYFLVLYNISPIQQGIQALHSAIEYSNLLSKKEEYQKWATEDKTVIILNGGTTSTMEKHFDSLAEIGINVVGFKEPDLNDSLTSLAFLVDERVWNKVKYPDLAKQDYHGVAEYEYWSESIGGNPNVWLREWLKGFRMA